MTFGPLGAMDDSTSDGVWDKLRMVLSALDVSGIHRMAFCPTIVIEESEEMCVKDFFLHRLPLPRIGDSAPVERSFVVNYQLERKVANQDVPANHVCRFSEGTKTDAFGHMLCDCLMVDIDVNTLKDAVRPGKYYSGHDVSGTTYLLHYETDA